MRSEPRTISDPQIWDQIVRSLPHSHLLQSWQWGVFKESFGWQALRMVWEADGDCLAAAQVLRRSVRLPLPGPPFQVYYVPRGPLLDWSDATLAARVLGDLEALTTGQRSVQLKIEPGQPIGRGFPGAPDAAPNPSGTVGAALLDARGWRKSRETVQFRTTMTLDLTASEDDLLAAMKQKTRYNIRLAGRKGVVIRPGDAGDLDLLYRMYAETSLRDGFAIRSLEYYHTLWGSFFQSGLAQPLIAEVDDQAVAAVIIYAFGQTALYMYGMSTEMHREKMPNYLLQWEAIRWARRQGCEIYDFWGAPDSLQTDEALGGVYRFKSGFSAGVVRSMGAWDYTSRPALYWSYNQLLPRLLSLMRIRGRQRTAASIDPVRG